MVIVAAHVTSLRKELKRLGVKNKEVLERTPYRFFEFLKEYSTGLNGEYTDFKSFKSDYKQMVVVECNFYSLCEHHLLPYFGKAFIAYMPKGRVVGVSKIAKLTQHLFKKPSMQENVTHEITEELSKNLDTTGVTCLVKGLHLCVAMRYKEGWVTTSSSTGRFKNNSSAKKEFLAYVQPRLDQMRL